MVGTRKAAGEPKLSNRVRIVAYGWDIAEPKGDEAQYPVKDEFQAGSNPARREEFNNCGVMVAVSKPTDKRL